MSFDEHMDYLEKANFSIAKGELHFSSIPDKTFLSALVENSVDLKLYFPLDQVLGDVTEISEFNWSFNIRQARLQSDVLIEEYVTIENISNIQNLVLELDAVSRDQHLDPDAIGNWQHSLLNFKDLMTFKIVFKTKRKLKKRGGGAERMQELESILSDLKYQMNPFTGGKLPETAIE